MQNDVSFLLSGYKYININYSHVITVLQNEKTEPDNSHIHMRHEIYINKSGDVSFLHGNKIYRIIPGDIIISKPGEVHHCIYHSDKPHEHYCLWFESDSDSIISQFTEKNLSSGIIRLPAEQPEMLFEILGKFENAVSSGTDFEKTVYFLNLLSLLTLKTETIPEQNPDIPPKMLDILNYIDTNFATVYSVNEISEKYHISTPTMNRWFRQYVCLSPYKLLLAKKMAYAEQLLKSEKNITEICFEAGFTDCSRFITLFREKHGMTPLKYRKNYLKKHL